MTVQDHGDLLRQRFRELHRSDNKLELLRLEDEIGRVEAQIADGDISKQPQRRDLLARRKQLRKLPAVFDRPIDDIDQDLEDLLNNDKVLRARVLTDGSIALTIRATTEYGNATYFIGDWVFACGFYQRQPGHTFNAGGRFTSWCVNSGVIRGGGYPDYTLPGGYRGEFCFGQSAAVSLGRLIDLGEYKAAFMRAIVGFNSINAQDRPRIPERFMLFSNLEEGEDDERPEESDDYFRF